MEGDETPVTDDSSCDRSGISLIQLRNKLGHQSTKLFPSGGDMIAAVYLHRMVAPIPEVGRGDDASINRRTPELDKEIEDEVFTQLGVRYWWPYCPKLGKSPVERLCVPFKGH